MSYSNSVGKQLHGTESQYYNSTRYDRVHTTCLYMWQPQIEIAFFPLQYNSDYPDVMGDVKYVRINGNPDNRTAFNIENMIWGTHILSGYLEYPDKWNPDNWTSTVFPSSGQSGRNEIKEKSQNYNCVNFHHLSRLGSVGRALDSGADGHGFKSWCRQGLTFQLPSESWQN